jgi:hypothetical protein
MDRKSKRKDIGAFPRWAKLVRFNTDIAGSSDLQKIAEDHQTVKRGRMSNPLEPPTNLPRNHSNIDSNLCSDDSYEREDSYLRLEAYRVASSIIERHLTLSIEHALTDPSLSDPSPLDSWINFVQKFEVDESDTSLECISGKICEKIDYYHRYHPTLLPVAVFNFSSSTLDRYYITQQLSKLFISKMIRNEEAWKNQKTRRPALCIVQYGADMAPHQPGDDISSLKLPPCHSSTHFNPVRHGCSLRAIFKEILKQVIHFYPKLYDSCNLTMLFTKNISVLNKRNQRCRRLFDTCFKIRESPAQWPPRCKGGSMIISHPFHVEKD